MKYNTVKLNEKQFLAVTSLYPDEFELLLDSFTPVCEKYFRYHTLEGLKRKIVTSKEHGNARLRGTAQKLFFLLVFLKTNSLQEQHAISFEISQSKVSRISKILLNLLNETLKKMNLAPFRDGELLQKGLADHPTKVFSYDGLERSIQRNVCVVAQEEEFSGKKKAHKIKNNLLCDEFQYIYYLSPTELGSVHDKTIADEYPLILPLNSTLKQDLGFVAHCPNNVTIEIPFKKPKKQELTFSQKIYNKLLSSTRIVVEHSNSGVKRLRIVKDIVRIHDSWFRDTVLSVACALHNFRTLSVNENRKYANSARV